MTIHVSMASARRLQLLVRLTVVCAALATAGSATLREAGTEAAVTSIEAALRTPANQPELQAFAQRAPLAASPTQPRGSSAAFLPQPRTVSTPSLYLLHNSLLL
jgi:hypothetical protein